MTDEISWIHLDDTGRELKLGPEKQTLAYIERITDIQSAYVEAVEVLETEKPPWLKKAELHARRFLGSLALDNLPKVYALEPGPELEALQVDGLGDRSPAFTHHYVSGVFVQLEQLTEHYQSGGPREVAGILVHDLAHTAVPPLRTVTLHHSSEGAVTASWRHGLQHKTQDKEGGIFLEEGLASWAEGWYRRCYNNSLAPAIAIDRPMPEFPEHYLPEKGSIDYHDMPCYGPDGYAMELLAWGCQQKNILSANEFVSLLLETRREETAEAARLGLREAVNELQAGLYDYLDELQYETGDWSVGFTVTFDTVKNL